MGRRSDIDWEKIQRLYVAGRLTLKEISEQCGGVSQSSIRLKAKQLDWQRNLSGAIKERAKAKIAQIDAQELIEQSAKESAKESAATIKKAIEEAANTQASIVIRHRNEMRKLSEQADRLDKLFCEVLDAVDPTRTEVSEDGSQVVTLNVGDLLKATQVYKNMVDSKAKLIDKERQAYGIEDGDEDSGDDAPTEIVVNLVGPNGTS